MIKHQRSIEITMIYNDENNDKNNDENDRDGDKYKNDSNDKDWDIVEIMIHR